MEAPEATGRRPLRRFVGGAFAVIALLFLGTFVVRNVSDLRQHEWTVRPLLMVASVGINIGALWWGVMVWQRLLVRMGQAVTLVELGRIWFISGLGRYIPGKIWQFVGAAQLGTSARIPRSVTVTSLAGHTGFFLIGGFLTAVYLLPPLPGMGGAASTVVRAAAPLVLFLAHPRVVQAALDLLGRVGRRQPGRWSARWIDGIVLVGLSVCGWVLTGLAFYLFVLSLTPIPISAIPAMIGINALGFVAGYIVFIAPAGLGAKEGALAALLSLYVPAPVAALVAVAARLWTVAAEVVPALLLLPKRSVERDPPRDPAEESKP